MPENPYEPPKGKSSAAPIIVAVALLLAMLGAYGAAYLSLVERRVSFSNPLAIPEYRRGGSFAYACFAPAHTIDRLIRPKYWTCGGVAVDPYDYETFAK